jgi:hypothetical protein
MVIHHFDAEWEMAQFCAAASPCAKTREILAGMAKERSQPPNPLMSKNKLARGNPAASMASEFLKSLKGATRQNLVILCCRATRVFVIISGMIGLVAAATWSAPLGDRAM